MKTSGRWFNSRNKIAGDKHGSRSQTPIERRVSLLRHHIRLKSIKII